MKVSRTFYRWTNLFKMFEKNNESTKNDLTATTYLWVNNLKLLQLLNQIHFSNSTEIKVAKTSNVRHLFEKSSSFM